MGKWYLYTPYKKKIISHSWLSGNMTSNAIITNDTPDLSFLSLEHVYLHYLKDEKVRSRPCLKR